MAIQMFNLKGKGSDQYFKVEDKLIEANYYWWKQSQEVVAACRKIDNLLCLNTILNIPLRK
jgi:hypothetical protein